MTGIRNVTGPILQAILLLILVGVAGCATEAPDPLDSAGQANDTATPRVESTALQAVIISDGLTAQSPYGGIGVKNWTGQLRRSLGQAGIDMYVRSSEGPAAYTDLGPPFTTFSREVTRRVNPDTDLVVLFGGAHDITAVESLGAEVTATVGTIREIAPAAKIIMVGPIWVRPEPPSVPMLALDDALAAAAADNGVEFISPIKEDWFTNHPEYMAPDGNHVTNAGHQAIAARLADRLADAARALATPTP
ncbi:hypothetical protein Mycsm_01353 [Mycobacterium sp. JS623]|uniref:SGNH/GDSL hydrolase family protein n=1 Tax=Mycobacterium sp. JS623 TaxID=212767 RepID=UPI0002A572D1|nr:SGNH/GDSL hydrolase family protein [Mycobacterium sp. JS623]AGB21765.1 hypothetical protein Mycsm_01353 [Mycobacterium sp. JS623]